MNTFNLMDSYEQPPDCDRIILIYPILDNGTVINELEHHWGAHGPFVRYRPT